MPGDSRDKTARANAGCASQTRVQQAKIARRQRAALWQAPRLPRRPGYEKAYLRPGAHRAAPREFQTAPPPETARGPQDTAAATAIGPEGPGEFRRPPRLCR